MAKMTRRDYAQMYGPTTGDAVRLGDTSLLAEVEHDFGVPGDECLHGGGKTLARCLRASSAAVKIVNRSSSVGTRIIIQPPS